MTRDFFFRIFAIPRDFCLRFAYTNSDIPQIGAMRDGNWRIPDTKLDPLGTRGIAEIGIIGTGAAISNAICHATGKRVRDLPITPDKLF